MRLRRLCAVMVIVVLLVTFVQPTRAEALEPAVIILIVSGAIVLISVLAVLIIANVTEYQRGIRTRVDAGPVRVVWQGPLPLQSP